MKQSTYERLRETGRPFKTVDREIQCNSCGWTATIHNVPVTDEYDNTDWFCPHCGKTAEGKD